MFCVDNEKDSGTPSQSQCESRPRLMPALPYRHHNTLNYTKQVFVSLPYKCNAELDVGHGAERRAKNLWSHARQRRKQRLVTGNLQLQLRDRHL